MRKVRTYEQLTPAPLNPGEAQAAKLAAKLATQGYDIYKGGDGKILADFLDKIVRAEDRQKVYTEIGIAAALAKNIGNQRGVSGNYAASYTDPLSIIRTLVELRTENMPVFADFRPEDSQKFSGFRARNKLQVEPEIILAAILYTAFPFNKKSGEIDPVDAASISGYLDRIKGTFDNPAREEKVLKILRGALMASEVNVGGEVSPAYQEKDGKPLNEKELAEAEAERVGRVLDILPQLKIPAGSILLRTASYSNYASDVINNPHSYGKREVEQVDKAISSIYMPLAAEYRQQAYQEGEVSTAHLLHTLKTKLKDQRLHLVAPYEYEMTRNKILSVVKELVPEDLQEYIKDIRSARALGLNRIARALLPLFPKHHLENLQIVARLKDIASTRSEVLKLYAEDLKKQGGLKEGEKPLTYEQILDKYFDKMRDGIGFRFIVTSTDVLPSDSREEKRAKEAGPVRDTYVALRQGIKTSYTKARKRDAIMEIEFSFVPDRMKNLYNEKTREVFFGSKGREDNGYLAIHDTGEAKIGNRSIRFEAQVTGENTDEDNEYGLGNHDGYKKLLPAASRKSRKKYVSVFTRVNEVISVPHMGTIADFLAASYGNKSLDPYRAFQAKAIEIKRTVHYYDSSLPAPTSSEPLKDGQDRVIENEAAFKTRKFSERVVPNDRIMFEMDSELAHDPAHRKLVIAACVAKETREILERLDKELAMNEKPYGPPILPKHTQRLDQKKHDL